MNLYFILKIDHLSIIIQGNACCAVLSWTGEYFGVYNTIYDSTTQICCIRSKQVVDKTIYQYSSVIKGNVCSKCGIVRVSLKCFSIYIILIYTFLNCNQLV